jgi:hypothetical protein
MDFRTACLALIAVLGIMLGADYGRVARASAQGPGKKTENKTAKKTEWSRHSRPFDLVWDTDNEDYNGLPLNPRWAYQMNHPNALPNFQKICGPAFPSGDSVDAPVLARDCTSQHTTLDTKRNIASAFGYCSGLIDGHLEWMVGTHTGRMVWSGWSGDAGLTNLGLKDGDYDLLLHSDAKDSPGYTQLNNGAPGGELGIGLEFKDDETLHRAHAPWWRRLVQAAENGSSQGQTADQMLGTGIVGENGLRGVVTGLIGIDGVHGGYAEYHPVFALALNTSVQGTLDSVRETWVFFLRTEGNGGGCSNNSYSWPSPHNHEYYIQLPWLKAAKTAQDAENAKWTSWPSEVSIVKGGFQFWAWQSGETKGWLKKSSDSHSTLIKVRFPGDGDFGVDGQFTIEYKFSKGAETPPGPGQWYAGGQAGGVVAVQSRRVRPSRGKKENEDDFQLTTITARIADPAVKAKFTKDADSALKPFSVRPELKSFPITFDTSLTEEPRTPGAASRGEVTLAKAAIALKEQQRDEVIKKLVDTYRPHIQPGQPAKRQPQAPKKRVS